MDAVEKSQAEQLGEAVLAAFAADDALSAALKERDAAKSPEAKEKLQKVVEEAEASIAAAHEVYLAAGGK